MLVPLEGPREFAQCLPLAAENISTMSDEELEQFYRDIVQVEIVVTQAYTRLAEIRDRILTMYLEHNVPLESDEIRFLREELLALYDAVFRQGLDLLAMQVHLNLAKQAYQEQADRYLFRVRIGGTDRQGKLKETFNAKQSNKGAGRWRRKAQRKRRSASAGSVWCASCASLFRDRA